MRWPQFIKLIRMIYRHQGPLPDLDWIQKQGLLAVKLGQVHALRIDFLDEQKCRHLAQLYRRNITVPPQELLPLLTQYGGPDYPDNFSKFDATPVASASVGQVHHAVLKNGREVAVKVVKRHVRESFIADANHLRRFFQFITFFYPKLRQVGDPVNILNDIREYTLSELDLTNELTGYRRLRRLHDANKDRFDLSHMFFAEIHETLSNNNLLVSDFIHGASFDELLEQGRLDYEQLLELFRIHGFFIFILGTFHGDIHPGNILADRRGLCFIDTGYIGTVGPKIRQGLFDFFDALSQWDYPACAAALHRMSEQDLTASAFQAFEIRFIALYKDFKDSSVSKISLTKKMMETIKLGVNSGMAFEKGIFAVIRSLMYLDGMVLRCNPDAVLLRDMRRFISEFKAVRQA